MAYTFRTALSVAALATALAATPALAQIGAPLTAGQAAGGGFGGGAIGGGGGFGGGGRVMTAPGAAAAVPQYQAPVVLPQARVPQAHLPQAHLPQAQLPQAYPGGGGVLATPRIGSTMVNPGQWTGGGLPHRGGIARQPRNWPQAGAPPNHDATLFHGGGRHHHGRGHWRGGVWVPYVVGGYDPYPAYGVYDDEEECVMRKVRVHTRHGWRRVWRRVCT